MTSSFKAIFDFRFLAYNTNSYNKNTSYHKMNYNFVYFFMYVHVISFLLKSIKYTIQFLA